MEKENEGKPWLDARGACEFLSCAPAFLRRLRAAGEVRTSIYGRKVWYERKSLVQFLRRHRTVKPCGHEEE